jgi:hypothetical protein
MKRRTFLKRSLTATTLAGLGTTPLGIPAASAAEEGGRDYYDLRTYRLKAADDRKPVEAYLEQAAIPAWNRMGVKAVGVFTPNEPAEEWAVHVLIPYPSIEAFVAATDRLNEDEAYQRAGEEYLSSPKSGPAFDRIDSWLLRAFSGIPRIELPSYCRERKPRVFEIRTYESHSETKAVKKVEMFNAGEIQAMREAGLGPIFFGQALAGGDLPHLTYLLSAESREAHKAHWKAFGQHPVWQRLKNDPQYADTVSRITSRFLIPTVYSQI